jgi:hypothetical protein
MKLDGYGLENLFDIVYEDIEYVCSLTYEDANRLFSYILNLSQKLQEDEYYHEFIYNYEIEDKFEDTEELKSAIIERLNEIMDSITRKCAATYKLYGLEELELVNMPVVTEGEKLTQPQVGLLVYYILASERRFTQPDWKQVANNYGYLSKTSDHKIYQHFTDMEKKENRIENRFAAKNITKVLKYLSDYPFSKLIAERELTEAETWLRNYLDRKL